MRNLEDLIESLAGATRVDVMQALSRETEMAELQARRIRGRTGPEGDLKSDFRAHAARCGRVLFFLHHGIPASGATEADLALCERILNTVAGPE